MSRTGKIVAASLGAWVFALSLALAVWLQAPATADDCGTEGCAPAGDLAFDAADLDFILKQIVFAERHADGEELIDILPNASIPWGLRTVDGRYNNLIPGQESFGQADLEFPGLSERQYPAAQELTVELGPQDQIGAPTHYNQGDGATVQDSTPRLISHMIVNQSVDNPAAVAACDANEGCVNLGAGFTGADQLVIPNDAVDEGLSAPFNAFMTFFGQFFDHGLDLVNKGGNGFVFIPLQEDDPLFVQGSPTNFMLLTRASLDAGPDGVIGTGDDVADIVNATTPHVDQQQTYASHASSQVLLREYETLPVGCDPLDLNNLCRLQSTGRLLEGSSEGGMATWDAAQAQASTLMGIDLDDMDGNNVPLIAADAYGNFIPCDAPGTTSHGLPVLVPPSGPPICGDTAAPADASAASRVNQSFFLDVAHSANPNGKLPDVDTVLNSRIDELSGQVTRGIRESGEPIAAGDPGCPGPDACETYDDELLGAHFVCGDGRCNENIALSTVHSIFHREHNRLTNVTKRVLLDAGNLTTLNEWLDIPQATFPAWGGLSFPVSDASLAHQTETAAAIEALGLDWNGERIFQAARFGTEMQYNRIVFDEFGPTLAGLKDDFEGFDSVRDPTINKEFSQSVYRFGHSMLTQTVDRFLADFSQVTDPGAVSPSTAGDQLGLFEAFLNPLALRNSDAAGVPTLSPEEGAGAVIRGLTRARGNEIDEFVTGRMQNNLVGLPLDMGAINIARGRDVGNPPLNIARKMFFARTFDMRLNPYRHWVDYLDNLRHEASFVNFLAVYGTHPSLAGANGIAGDGDVGEPISFADRRAAACEIASKLAATGAHGNPATYCADIGISGSAPPITETDALAFLYSPAETSGVDDIDFWNGGLAEERMPFGGFLGSTHNYVFEKQLEALQDGDRFYYVGRTANINFFSELESNSFTALAMRNTDLGEAGGGSLPLNIFAKVNWYLEVDETQQATTDVLEGGGGGQSVVTTADPDAETDLLALVIRDANQVTTNITIADPNLFVQYTGGDHVVIGGTEGDDTLIGGIGDDSLWGRAGNDRIEGGDGADHIEGGPGDDIITDLSGPDVIEGGEGNDAISSGNEEDVIFGDAGHDFIVNQSEFGEIFAGSGNDFIFDGTFIGHIRGGAGDDWMENLGGGEDLWQGDDGAAAEAGEPSVKGNDVAIAHSGNNDWDMENGDDIVVDGPGIDRVEGQLGFDWVSFQNDKFGVNVDLDLTIFLKPILPPSNSTISNRYDRVEAISGSAFGDVLRGTANSATENSGNELVVTASRDGFSLIEGLNDAPGNPGLVPLTERGPLPNDPVTGEAQSGWTGGEIIVGGGGSDLLVGEGGNDILDGDSALTVNLQVAGDATLYAGMEELFEPVFTGSTNPGDISISRVIANADPSCQDTDTALYSGNRADYLIEAAGLDFIRVTDERELPVNLPVDRPNNDGADLVRNVERLAFGDMTEQLVLGVGGSCGLNNTLATGSPSIVGLPELDSTLTASYGTIVDAEGFDPEAIEYTWESELEPGSGFFQPITRLEGVNQTTDAIQAQPLFDGLVNAHGDSMLVTVNEIGLRVRVAVLFQDGAGVFEIARSEPVSVPIPDGFELPEGVEIAPVAAFGGVCAELASLTPVVENASGDGLPRFDLRVNGVPLASFTNTASEFAPGFGAASEILVSNLGATFVTNATNMPTGSFTPEIVAIQDVMTGDVDPNNVDILWSLRGGDVNPLVDGPTTVTFSLDGCGMFATAMLDGDSSVDSAQGVVVTFINGNPAPLPPGGLPGAPITIDRVEFDPASDRLRVEGSVNPVGSSATLYRSSTVLGDVVSDGVNCNGGRLVATLPTDPADGSFKFDSGNGALPFADVPVCVESDNGSALDAGQTAP